MRLGFLENRYKKQLDNAYDEGYNAGLGEKEAIYDEGFQRGYDMGVLAAKAISKKFGDGNA